MSLWDTLQSGVQQWGNNLKSAAGFVGELTGQLTGTKYAHDLQQASADKAMAFSERMASTEAQRRVADLRAAGLNPLLAANPGGGSSPSGASAGAGNPDFSGVLSGVSQLLTLKANIGKLQADTRKSLADSLKTESETKHVDRLLTSQSALNEWNAKARSTDELLAKLLNNMLGKDAVKDPMAAGAGMLGKFKPQLGPFWRGFLDRAKPFIKWD